MGRQAADPITDFAFDKNVQRMRRRYTFDFMQAFEKGYVNYEAGEWDVAADVLRETSQMLVPPGDGPSVALLDYITSFDSKAPANWPGYREFEGQGGGQVSFREESMPATTTWSTHPNPRLPKAAYPTMRKAFTDGSDDSSFPCLLPSSQVIPSLLMTKIKPSLPLKRLSLAHHEPVDSSEGTG